MNDIDFQLQPDEAKAYAEDGFFVRRRTFGEREVEAFRAAAERVAERARQASVKESYEIDGNVYREAAGATIQLEHQPGSRTLRVIEPFHHLDDCFDELVDDPRITEPMRGILGSEQIALYTDKLNLKRPRDGSRFRWHQDSPYWLFACAHLDQLPNVMLTLDDADRDNGCFRVIRASHREGLLPGQDEGELGPLFTDPDYFDESDQVLIEVPAGSLVFFSPHTVHGSEPNTSTRPRRALVLTYQPAGHRMFKIDRVREIRAAEARA